MICSFCNFENNDKDFFNLHLKKHCSKQYKITCKYCKRSYCKDYFYNIHLKKYKNYHKMFKTTQSPYFRKRKFLPDLEIIEDFISKNNDIFDRPKEIDGFKYSKYCREKYKSTQLKYDLLEKNILKMKKKY